MNNRSHRKNHLASLAALAALGAASAGPSQAAPTPAVTRVYVVEVASAKDHAFREGIKAWHQCLRANGDHATTLAYDAETGALGRYAFLVPHRSWAGIDRTDPAGKACRALFREGVLPNVSGAWSEILQEDPEVTWMPEGDPGPAPMLWVSAFRIKPGQTEDFHAGLEKFSAAAAKTHWARHFTGYDVMGAGQGGEQFLLVSPKRSWADAGALEKLSIKDMMYSAYGKSAAQSNHQRFFGSVAAVWSDAWSYDKELSLTSGK